MGGRRRSRRFRGLKGFKRGLAIFVGFELKRVFAA